MAGAMTGASNDTSLRGQYEAYPYPPRDPKDEANRLVTGSPSHLAEINHYIYGGRRDFTKPFNALVAGGGTGDATIMIAQQLADAGSAGKVTHLDLSEASLEIAKARAKARELTNIEFVRGSILDLGDTPPELYDYIDCCGVLHHLDDPGAGLTRLANILTQDGGMGLMVYAPYGRIGVYHVQEMLRMINGQDSPADQVEQAKSLLETLPPTNWLRRNPHVTDHLTAGDSGLFDLLLHSQDQAYSVSELATLVADTDLRIVAFLEPIRYDPAVYLGNQRLAERVERLSWLDRCAFAELLTGNLKTHVFYAVKSANTEDTIATLANNSSIPVLIGLDATVTASAMRETGALPTDLDGLALSIPFDGLACDILMRMDGATSIDGIFDKLKRDNQLSDRHQFDTNFGRLFTVLNGLNLAFLRS